MELQSCGQRKHRRDFVASHESSITTVFGSSTAEKFRVLNIKIDVIEDGRAIQEDFSTDANSR